MKIKKTSKMKLLSSVLSLILLIGILPTTVFAADSEELWVNNVNILTAENNTVLCGDGHAVYNIDTATLTLTNATIETGYNGRGIVKIGDVGKDNLLNIVLVGENHITTNASNPIHAGVYSDGKVEISGEGSLNITTATTSASYLTYGIFAWAGCSITDATISMKDTSTLTDHFSSAIDVNQFESALSVVNANISIDGYDTGANVPSGDVTMNGSSFTVTNANRGISGGNEIDNFRISNSTVTAIVTGENALGLLNGRKIQIDNSTVNLSSETSNAIYTDDAITITNGSDLDVTGFYPALFSTLNTTITDSKVKATSTNDSAIFSKGNIVIDGTSDVTAKGYWAAINAVKDITINNGKVNATSTNDMGIWARNSIAFNGGKVYAKGADGMAAIGVRYEKQAEDTDPVEKITLNNNHADVSGGKISVSNWFSGTDGDTPWTRSWTSFIASDDENKLATNRLNALNEVSIQIKAADYSKVDKAIETANALNKDNYKDFSAVTAAINAVLRDKDITEQETVDDYATTIENSIKAMELKSADYSKVDKAIETANALNKDNYKDFSAVTTAINAVVRGKDITEQETVNVYAIAIENVIAALELKSVTPPISKPKIIEGNNQSVEQGKPATFKSNADLKDFQKVLVDDKEISSENYTVEKGSTIVTLKADFVKTLSEGKHTLSIVSTTGSADTDFTITKSTTPTPNPDTNTPQTGDNSTMILWVEMLFLSAGGVLVLLLKRKKLVK